MEKLDGEEKKDKREEMTRTTEEKRRKTNTDSENKVEKMSLHSFFLALFILPL